MERGIRLIGNGQCPVQKYWKQLLEMLEKDEIDMRVLVTHRIDLKDTEKLYRKFDERNQEDGIMKVFLQTKHSFPPAPGFPSVTSL